MGDQNLEKSLFASAMSRSSISAYIFTAVFSGITPRAMSAWRKACCCLFRAVSMFVISQNWAPFFVRLVVVGWSPVGVSAGGLVRARESGTGRTRRGGLRVGSRRPERAL